MAQVTYFMRTRANFALLEAVRKRVAFSVSFRRFASSGHAPGYYVPSEGCDSTSLYLAGGFQEVYLCTSGHAPSQPQDWAFFEREAAHLLVLEGGREAGSDLEAATLRVIAKQSRSARAYAAIRRAVKARSRRGLTTVESQTFYPDVFYAPDLGGFTLRHSFAAGSFTYGNPLEAVRVNDRAHR
jgi:hypothetical protein